MESLEHMLDDLKSAADVAVHPAATSAKLYDKLVASECTLLEAYNNSIGAPPIECDAAGGVIELGPILHYLNNPPTGFETAVDIAVLVLDLVEGEALPASGISPELWQEIVARTEGPGLVAADGTIYGRSKYEQLDPGWLISVAGWLYYLVRPGKVHPFVTGAKTITLAGTNSIKIGIIGDWGTGTYGPDGGPAQAVMTALQAQHVMPDYLMHLGDVYYAGSQSEEQDNLLDLWAAPWGPGCNNAFTLNSNHEMYDGANAYYDTALAAGGPFSEQAGVSYYAATFGDWLILGLDSAWFADPDAMYMNGSIGGSNGEQATWIADNFRGTDKQVIVLTHHNPMTTAGDRLAPDTTFYDDVTSALGKPPAYWYFGHTHNGVVYNKKSAMGAAGTKARLCGHGAIPFGNASAFDTEPGQANNDYFSHTPVPGAQVRVQNGFATIELTADGAITETFYELNGTDDPAARWTSSG